MESMEVPRSVYLPLLSIGFFLKNNLTKTALGHHLSILRLNENSHIKQLSSVHNLLSKYRHLKTETKKSYICGKKKCSSLLVMDEKGKNPLPNQPCGHKRAPRLSAGAECYIVKLPIGKQIAHFIRQHGLPAHKPVDPNIRGDVNSGGCYRQLKEEGVIDDRTITLQLNTDGAEVFEVVCLRFIFRKEEIIHDCSFLSL